MVSFQSAPTHLREELDKESFLNGFKLHYAGKDEQARIGFINKPPHSPRLNIATIDWQTKENRFKVRVGADKRFSQLKKDYTDLITLKNSGELKIEAFLTNEDDIEKIVELIIYSATYHSNY